MAPTRPPSRAVLARWLRVARSWQPSPTHDGKEVLYLSDRSGLPLAWRVPATGGPARLASRSTDRIGRADASPRSAVAMLSRDTSGNEVWQLELVSLAPRSGGGPAPAHALTHDPAVMHLGYGWMDDGRRYLYASNQRDARFFDVYAREAESSASPREILRGDSWHTPYATRGERVLVGRFNTFLDVDLFLCGSGPPRHLNPHSRPESIPSATIGLDGVYAAANPDREFQAVFRYPFDGSEPELLREYPGDVELVRASPDGDALLVVLNRDGWSEMRVIDLATGAEHEIPLSPRGVVAEAQWFRSGDAIVHDLSWPEGHEIFRSALDGTKPTRLTRSPVAPPARLREPRLHQVAAEDGLSIPYWEHVGPSAGSRGTLVFVHGGPEGQARPMFDPAVGFAVSEGWRVIEPNVRGSMGYGRTYIHLDDVRKRMDSVRDLRDLARALFRDKKGREGEVGIFGGSYGGFMVLSAITTYPELWGPAVEWFGISNFITFLERTADYRRPLREAEYGSLWRDREFLIEISPIHHLDRLRSPLLVAHGKNDVRVPFVEAEQIVSELRRRGSPVELVAFDDEGHGFSRRENQLEALHRSFQFLTRYARPNRGRATRSAVAGGARRSSGRRGPRRKAR